MTGEQLILEADGCRAVVDLEHGGRLASLVVGGWELLVREGTDVYHWGSFVLAPWAGRLRHGRFSHDGREYRLPLTFPPHAIHGLVVDRLWQPISSGVVAIDLPQPWPWPGRVTHSMQLFEDRLESHLELSGQEAMPAAMGWHPWFPRFLVGPDGRRAGPVELLAMPAAMYEHDDEGLPTGRLVPPVPRPWNYCFTGFASGPRLRWPGPDGLVIELELESDCSCWVIFDEEPQAVAVEPWSAPPDSLNLPTPMMVTPDTPLAATMTWRWRLRQT